MVHLVNIEEEAPNEFYIFVDRANIIAQNNFQLTGRFVSSGAAEAENESGFLPKYLDGSATYHPFAPCDPDCHFISPYLSTAINQYRVEYDAERYRHMHYGTYPSRLSAVFAFGDYQSCVAAHERWGWSLDEVKRFRLQDWSFTRIAKVNMEIVSLARHAYKVSSLAQADIDNLWRAYWTGTGEIVMKLPAVSFERNTHNSGIIWEYLIEGRVDAIDEGPAQC